MAMSETAHFTIGAEVSCSDGACGEVRRVVVDPIAEAVTHLVVGPEHPRGLGQLVPVDLIDATAGEIRLRCTLAEFARLSWAKETQFLKKSGVYSGYAPGQVFSWPYYGVGGRLTAVHLGDLPQTVTRHSVPLRKDVAIPVSAALAACTAAVSAADRTPSLASCSCVPLNAGVAVRMETVKPIPSIGCRLAVLRAAGRRRAEISAGLSGMLAGSRGGVLRGQAARPGAALLAGWPGRRGAAVVRGCLFAGEQVDPVAGSEGDAGVGVAQGAVVQDRDRDPAVRPGDVAECPAGGGRARGDGDFQDLVAAQRGGRLADGSLRPGRAGRRRVVPARWRPGRCACGGRRPAARSGW